jgi:hypothetical protein
MPRKPEPEPHGPKKARCICPGCKAAVPACWMSGMCPVCVREACGHLFKPAARERRKRRVSRATKV